jgi:hypothetical protein
MITKPFWVVLVTATIFGAICHGAQRTWRDTSNEHTVEAELLSFDGETVTLRKADGTTIGVALDRLSKKDRAFILENPKTGLGVEGEELTEATATALKRRNVTLPVTNGIFVTKALPKTPINQAGIQTGDIIATVDHKPVRAGSFAYLDPDKSYEIVVYRPHPKKTNADTTPRTAPATKTGPAAKAVVELDWEKLTLSVKVLPVARLAQIKDYERQEELASQQGLLRGHVPVENRATPLAEWKEWEKRQSQLDADRRPFELKADRLGMTLDMFKSKYYRVVKDDNRCAPMCSDDNPSHDNPLLLYTADLARAGIVHARTTFPFEAYGSEGNIPTIAGVPTELFLYHFVNGKLYKITVLFSHNNFGKVLDALKAKYGEPKGKTSRTYQNSYGAKFTGEVILWENATSAMLLHERADRLDSSQLTLVHQELAKIAADNIKSKVKPRTDDL